MKKIYFLLIALFAAPMLGSAQITVNASDVADVGDIIMQSRDDDATSLVPIVVATAHTWDFTSLSHDEGDTTVLESPTGLPGSSLFPNATIAVNGGDGDFIFIEKSSSKFSIVGIVDTTSGGDTMAVDWQWMSFPATMGTSYSSTFFEESEKDSLGFMGVDSFRLTFGQRIKSKIEGWGAVQLPNGNFDALLQVMHQEQYLYADSKIGGVWSPMDIALLQVFGVDTGVQGVSTTWRFWGNDANEKFMLAEFDTAFFASASWSPATNASPPVFVEVENDDNKVVVYPNPVDEKLYVNIKKQDVAIIELHDLLGQRVGVMNAYPGRNDVDVEHLAQGFYILSLRNNAGDIVGTERIVVE